jgi:hypothetical protein
VVPGGSSGRILLAATAVCISAAVGGVILAWVPVRYPGRLMEAMIGAVSVRLLMTVLCTLVVKLSGYADDTFLISVAVLYIIGLICETTAAILLVKQGYSCELAGQTRSGSAPQ